ncbi:uncharacterized protein NKAPD1-like isoform X1 [Pomacea canaliculata]|uniref:uncharacterized protein NKAPD1-like isoform X1 n=1 Tax=Pomacea canaliculata TaxID=400727 RepID=UPI000D729D66|nr:uncharacterized protein NKAPD1-like isoform X1 [Pomacea canaliculata]XP_025100228.1 uncharacterized protein NKAPD1-like isoform X1 [Pomacea canaliculata]XP_025100229.1 uncharacterized protein NKAPD1-like isoform X1 [Pomacea canaliculata]
MSGIFSKTTKLMLRNVLRHTDSHNRVVEEAEMWQQYERQKTTADVGPNNPSFHHDDRWSRDLYSGQHKFDRKKRKMQEDRQMPYMDQDNSESTFWMRQLDKAERSDPNRRHAKKKKKKKMKKKKVKERKSEVKEKVPGCLVKLDSSGLQRYQHMQQLDKRKDCVQDDSEQEESKYSGNSQGGEVRAKDITREKLKRYRDPHDHKHHSHKHRSSASARPEWAEVTADPIKHSYDFDRNSDLEWVEVTADSVKHSH